MSNSTVSEIKRFMRQMDLTDMNRIEQLMEGYISVVKEYNGLCERVRGLIKNNMVEELERFLNELETPLQEQYKELRQAAVKEFLETAELYGLEAPVLENVFDEIQGAMLSNMGLRPLLIRYRQIARSNNLQAKVNLIRQILALNPEDALEWERNLTSFEEEWKAQLQESAKQAILSEDYQELKQIQETILEEPWKTPFNEHVVVKVAQVLEEEERRAKKRLCEQLIASSESMLSQPGKLKEVTATLAKVNALQMEGIQLDSDWQQRFVTLEENTKRLVTQAAEEEKFAKLFFELEQKMSSNAPIEQIDKIFYEMQRLRREIPDITMRRVETYRQNALMAAKRKKMLGLIIGMVVAVLLLGTGVFGFRIISRNMTIKEYSGRLRTAIDDQAALSDAGYEILKEIETKVPDIRNATEIAELAEELATKRKTEEEKRVKFKELQLTLSTQLENYAENATSIVELLKEIQGQALPEHQRELEELTQQHDEKRAKYVRIQDAAYRKLCGDAGDAYIAMKTAMAEHLFDSAREFLPTIAEKLKEAGEIPDVSFEAKGSLKNLVEEYAQAPKTLEQSIKDFDIGNKIKELETLVKEYNENMTYQQLAKAEELCEKIRQKEKEISGEIKSANSFLRSQFVTLQDGIKEFDKRQEELRELIVEEEKVLTAAFNKNKLSDVQEAIQEFQSKYPNSFNRKDISKLLDDFSKSLAGSLDEYDAELHTRSQHFNQLFEKLAKGLQDELLKRRDDYIANPVYMLGFTNKQNNALVDLYLKKTDADKDGDGLKLNKTLGAKVFIIKGANILGFDELTDAKMDYSKYDDAKRIDLTLGNNVSFNSKLDYPSFHEIQNKKLNSPGYYGNWLLSIKNNSFDFRELAGWELLDRNMISLFNEKSDAVRSVHFWIEIVDSILSISPALKKGGEFEMTEALTLKQELSRLMGSLPEGSKWYSASWEHQNETSEFYRNLKEFCSNEPEKWSFSQAIHRLQQQSKDDKRVLVPCGVMAWRKLDDEYSWYFYQVGLSINSEGELFVADHNKQKSIVVGDYSFKNYKLRWRFRKEADISKGYYVMFIKK